MKNSGRATGKVKRAMSPVFSTACIAGADNPSGERRQGAVPWEKIPHGRNETL